MAQLLTMGAATLQTAVTVTTTNETLVLVAPPVSNPTAGGAMVIIASVGVAIGTGGNGLWMRIRRGGTLTGPLVDIAWHFLVTAGTLLPYVSMAVDRPGDQDHLVYALTVSVDNATANSTVYTAGILVLTI